MRNIYRLAIMACTVASVLMAGPFVRVAAAWQCAELSEYVEVFDDAEDQNDTLGIFARGVADAGEPCSVTVRT